MAEVSVQTDHGNDDVEANANAATGWFSTVDDAKSADLASKTDGGGGGPPSAPEDERPSAVPGPDATGPDENGPVVAAVEVAAAVEVESAAAADAENGCGEEVQTGAETPPSDADPGETDVAATVAGTGIGNGNGNGNGTGNGNKAEPAAPLIASEQGLAVAEAIGAFAFFECSAKTKEGVRDVFVAAVRAIRRENRHGQCALI